jgi:DNA-binding beta-propeller fold protein YncE
MKTLYSGVFLSLMVYSCGLFETEDENNNLDIVYIALQDLDQVGIVNSKNGDLKVVDIDYDPQMKETPHFIVIDEINKYWFVTTIVSGYVGRYNMDTDELIDTLFIGDSPALMVANEIDKILYVSRMMPGGMGTGSVSTIIHEIDYSDPLKMSTKQEIELGSPAPHGIAINSTGSEVFVTSNTADWIYKISTATGEISGKVMDASIGNYPDNVTQRLKPIQVVSVEDSLLFVTCSAGIWVNPYTGESDTLSGLVQLWNSNTLTLYPSHFQFSWNSSPWHIIQSPVNREVYVVLSGDVLYPGSAGIACLNFESNTLALKWETHSESFETLHGIDVSSDGEQIYVSGRKDGNLHIFNGGTGKLERSIPLGNNPLAGGVQVFSSP